MLAPEPGAASSCRVQSLRTRMVMVIAPSSQRLRTCGSGSPTRPIMEARRIAETRSGLRSSSNRADRAGPPRADAVGIAAVATELRSARASAGSPRAAGAVQSLRTRMVLVIAPSLAEIGDARISQSDQADHGSTPDKLRRACSRTNSTGERSNSLCSMSAPSRRGQTETLCTSPPKDSSRDATVRNRP